jgi:hypothetical protein
VGFKEIILCILTCSRLIRYYMNEYGCGFPKEIESLDSTIRLELKKFK